MPSLVVHPAPAALFGSVPVPPDLLIAHRALILGGLAKGLTRLTHLTLVGDLARTADALRAVGVGLEPASAHEIRIRGGGLDALQKPELPLGVGGSSTALALLCGVLSGQRFESTVRGDEHLRDRSLLARIVAPLRARRANLRLGTVDERGSAAGFSLVVGPLPDGEALAGIDFASPSSDAEVKGALLLSGLYADGPTRLVEPRISCDHTERLLSSLGVPLRTAGSAIELDPGQWGGHLPAFDIAIPGDLSAATFLVAAAQLVQGSRVTVRGVGVNPTRTGFLEVARDMGAGLGVEPKGESGGEPLADIHAWSCPLRAMSIGGETVSRGIGEIPAACALAARARGTTRVCDAAGSTAGGLDRLAEIARVLRAFGIACEVQSESLDVEGRDGPLEPADVDAGGDDRLGMMAAVLALVARSPSKIAGAGCIAASYPKFVATLRALGARIEVVAVC
jgi:3-phosphoshikimate 1-carboxyvinyltransferase